MTRGLVLMADADCIDPDGNRMQAVHPIDPAQRAV